MMVETSLTCRSRRHTSMPSMSGRPRSSRTKSASGAVRAAAPVATRSVVMPYRLNPSARGSAIDSSSSTSRTRTMPPRPGEIPATTGTQRTIGRLNLPGRPPVPMAVIRRLLLTYVSLTLVVLAGLALPLGYVYQRGEQPHALAQLEHDAETLAAFIDTDLGTNHPSRTEALVHDAARRWNARIDLVGADGRPVVTTRTDGSATPDLGRVLASHTPVFSEIGDGRM